jgi:hypothetical protein
MGHEHLYTETIMSDAEVATVMAENAWNDEQAESVYEADIVAGEMEFRTRVIDAFCEVCSEQDKGTAMQLERRFWKLTSLEQFCPMHREG